MIYQLERGSGPVKRKWGIRFTNLEPHHQRILLDNPLIQDRSKSDQFVLILFRMADLDKSNKQNRKIYYNPYKDSVDKYRDILKHSRQIEWKCAITGKKIMSELGNFEPNNFLADECKEEFGNKSKIIDQRIIESSLNFRKHCKKLLMQQQKLYLKNVKMSSQADL